MSTFIERLEHNIENRGLMANLRCGLVANKKHRAWPALHRLGVPVDQEIPAFIAGLFATHPHNKNDGGNFGATCLAIQKARKDSAGDNKLTPTERRFQHLLAAERDELPGRILRMVLMAKSVDVPVNYSKMQIDMKYWNNKIKQKWASAFWTQENNNNAKKEGDK